MGAVCSTSLPLSSATPPPEEQVIRGAAATAPSAPLPSNSLTQSTTAQNLAVRQTLSEKTRQFLLTLSIKRADNREADYIAVWNESLPGLNLTPERLRAYNTTPPEREALVEAILANRDAENVPSNHCATL